MGTPPTVDAKSEIKLVPNFVKIVSISCYDDIRRWISGMVTGNRGVSL